MRRATLLTAMAVLILAIGAGIAYAATIQGTSGPDHLVGTPERDTIYGYKGTDVLEGLAGTDTLQGGAGPDDIFGGPGADVLRGRDGDDELFGGVDGKIDEFFCGKGNDIAHVEGPENSTQNLNQCETVVPENR